MNGILVQVLGSMTILQHCLVSLMLHSAASYCCTFIARGFEVVMSPFRSMCVAGCIPLADCYLKRKATKGLIRPVYAKMEVGSKPTIPLRSTVISRPEVLEEVKVAIGFPQRPPGVVSRDVDKDDLDVEKGFCVIVSPSGTGKTVLYNTNL